MLFFLSLCLSLIRTVNTTQLWLKSRFVYYRWHIDTEVASNELQFCERKEKKMALSWIMKKFLIDINYSCSRKQSTKKNEHKPHSELVFDASEMFNRKFHPKIFEWRNGARAHTYTKVEIHVLLSQHCQQLENSFPYQFCI